MGQGNIYTEHYRLHGDQERRVFGFKSAPLFYSSSFEDARRDRDKGRCMRKGNELSICYVVCEEAIGFSVSHSEPAGEGSE